ncbi:recombinase family protein [Nitrospira sp. Nam74]
MDEDERRKQIKEGMKLQFLAGFSIGQVPLGYISRAVKYPGSASIRKGQPRKVRYQITVNAEKAIIVQRIFHLYVTEHSFAGIAALISKDFVTCPITEGRVRRIICNPIYHGRAVYNRFRYERNPVTGVKIKTDAPPKDWLIWEDDSLRIVDEETWGKAQFRWKRDQQRRRHYGRSSGSVEA